MRKQELVNKSDIEKKSHVSKGRSSQRGPEMGTPNDHLGSIFSKIGAEGSPDSFLSILNAPELSRPENASQKPNIINNLQQAYGNAYVQRMIEAKRDIAQHGNVYKQEAEQVYGEPGVSDQKPIFMRSKDETQRKVEDAEKSLMKRLTKNRDSKILQLQESEEEEKKPETKTARSSEEIEAERARLEEEREEESGGILLSKRSVSPSDYCIFGSLNKSSSKSNTPDSIPEDVKTALSRRISGNPLPTQILLSFQCFFKKDLTNVRAHKDSIADKAC